MPQGVLEVEQGLTALNGDNRQGAKTRQYRNELQIVDSMIIYLCNFENVITELLGELGGSWRLGGKCRGRLRAVFDKQGTHY